MHLAALIISTLLSLATAGPQVVDGFSLAAANPQVVDASTTAAAARPSDLPNSAALAGMISTLEREAGVWITKIPAWMTPQIPNFDAVTAGLAIMAHATSNIPAAVQSLETDPARLSSFIASYDILMDLDSQWSTAGAPAPTVAVKVGGVLLAAGLAAMALL